MKLKEILLDGIPETQHNTFMIGYILTQEHGFSFFDRKHSNTKFTLSILKGLLAFCLRAIRNKDDEVRRIKQLKKMWKKEGEAG